VNYLFVIPARAGSKGIPGKNKKILAGKPLISYTIECALEVTKPENICVTTDDDDVISIANQFLIEIPFKRPIDLSTDTASTFDVIKHALLFYEAKNNFKMDFIVLLQPTSPFRKSSQLKDAIALFNLNIDMVVSVNLASSKLVFMEDENGFLKSTSNRFYELRQDSSKAYNYNGAIYVINRNSLMNKKIDEFEKIIKYEMDELTSMDIDTPLDWEIADFLMKNRINE
jgi:CMP-N,N'-diacetyllegionaminic acid synthase